MGIYFHLIPFLPSSLNSPPFSTRSLPSYPIPSLPSLPVFIHPFYPTPISFPLHPIPSFCTTYLPLISPLTFPPLSSGYPSSDVKYEYGQKANESIPLSAEEVRERELRFQQFLGRQQQSALKNQQHLKSVNSIKSLYLRTVLYCKVMWKIELISSFSFCVFP